MNFEMSQQEAASVIDILGKLPTNSGAYPLLVKLVSQFNAQAAAPTEETKDEPESN